VEAIILNGSPRRRLLLTTLAETGMRISELLAVEWADVDQAGERLRVRQGKTAADRPSSQNAHRRPTSARRGRHDLLARLWSRTA
jgi:integrase